MNTIEHAFRDVIVCRRYIRRLVPGRGPLVEMVVRSDSPLTSTSPLVLCALGGLDLELNQLLNLGSSVPTLS